MVAVERSIGGAKDAARPYRGDGGRYGLSGIRRRHKGCASRSRFRLLETKRGISQTVRHLIAWRAVLIHLSQRHEVCLVFSDAEIVVARGFIGSAGQSSK